MSAWVGHSPQTRSFAPAALLARVRLRTYSWSLRRPLHEPSPWSHPFSPTVWADFWTFAFAKDQASLPSRRFAQENPTPCSQDVCGCKTIVHNCLHSFTGFLDSFALDYVWLRLHGIIHLLHKRSLSMRKFLVGFFIVLFLSGISLAIISCVTDGGTGSSPSQQSQPQKVPAKGGWARQ